MEAEGEGGGGGLLYSCTKLQRSSRGLAAFKKEFFFSGARFRCGKSVALPFSLPRFPSFSLLRLSSSSFVMPHSLGPESSHFPHSNKGAKRKYRPTDE